MKTKLKIKDKVITACGELAVISGFYDGIVEVRYPDAPKSLDLKGQYYADDLKRVE